MQPLARPLVRPLALSALGESMAFTPHPRAVAYSAALEGAGKTISQPSMVRLSKAFQALESGGILDELVLGVYLGSDAQLSSGAPLDLNGNAAVLIAGSLSRGANGFTASQSDTQGIGFSMPDTRTGTVFADVLPGGTLGVTGAGTVALVQGNSGVFWYNGHHWGYDGTNKIRLNTIVSGGIVTQTSLVGQSVVARALPRNSRQCAVHGFTYGNADVKHWVNGVESNPSPNKTSAAQSVAQTRFSLFGRMNSDSAFSSVDRFVGTVRSAFVFSRELNTTEARAASVAAICLNPAPAMLIIEGDSTAEQVDFLTRTDDHWGRRLEVNHAGWAAANVLQHNVATSGMAAESYDHASYLGWDNQIAWLTPSAIGKRVIFSIQGGANDIGVDASGGPRTVAQIYGYMLAMAAKAKAAGMKTMIHTMPIPQAPTWNATQQAKLAALNAHILAHAATDGFNYVVDAAAAVDMTNAANRADDVHANGVGNALWAAAVNTILSAP